MWYMLVVPATLEAKAGGSLEHRRLRLHWAVTVTLHYNLCALQPVYKNKQKRKKVTLLSHATGQEEKKKMKVIQNNSFNHILSIFEFFIQYGETPPLLIPKPF